MATRPLDVLGRTSVDTIAITHQRTQSGKIIRRKTGDVNAMVQSALSRELIAEQTGALTHESVAEDRSDSVPPHVWVIFEKYSNGVVIPRTRDSLVRGLINIIVSVKKENESTDPNLIAKEILQKLNLNNASNDHPRELVMLLLRWGLTIDDITGITNMR